MAATRLWLLLATCGVVRAGSDSLSSCPQGELVTYRLDIETHWSKRRFPKQYPLFRPPAQFSKFVGMSHNGSRVMFRPGELATEAVRSFAEHGDASGLEVTAQGHAGVLDQFIAPAVKQGEGSALVRVFVDAAHSQVSLLSRIVPSPDWFIGIDSVNLCDSGRWIGSMDVKLFPMDAGTDQGLTFTSPNWESDPREPIYQITNLKPKHPAASFYYPDLPSLPHIASLRFTRVRSFTLSEEFDDRDTVSYTVDASNPSRVLHSPTSLGSSVNVPGLRVFGATSAPATTPATPAVAKPDQVALTSKSKPTPRTTPRGRSLNEISQWPPTKKAQTKKWSRGKVKSSASSRETSKWTLLSSGGIRRPATPAPSTNPRTPAARGSDSSRQILRPGEPGWNSAVPSDSVSRIALRPDGSVARVALRPDGPPLQIGGLRVWAVRGNGSSVEGARVAAGDKKAIIKKISDHYQRRRGRHRRRRLRHRKRKRVPRDCTVGAWSEWGPCSRTCGIGETTRSRRVAKHSRRGGRPCPPLSERRWCGSARSCRQRRRYFQW